ncbi:MAG: hypothetical protein ABII01_06155 [Candidatus Woesearchaeota archaeon]
MGNRIIKFIYNILRFNEIKFSEGLLHLSSLPYTYFEVQSFSDYLLFIQNEFDEQYKKIIYEIGRNQGKMGALIIIKRFGFIFKGSYKMFIEQSDLIGYGSAELYSVNEEKKEYKIRITNMPIALKANQSKKSKEVMNFYFSGLISGVLETIHKKNFYTIETQCLGRGDKSCNFVCKLEKKKDLNENHLKIEKEIEKCFTSVFAKLKSISNNKKEKLPFSFTEGSVGFENTQGVLFPCYCIVILNKKLEEINNKKARKALMLLAEGHVKRIIKKRNQEIKTKDELIFFLNRLSLSCFGKFIIVKSNLKNLEFIIKNINNPFADEYKKIFGISKNPTDLFLAQVLENLFQTLFTEKFKCEELICIAQGKKECVFVIKSLSKI